MADKKISQLTAASTPLAGTEVLPIVQSGSTVKVASDDLTVKNVRSNATSGILQVAGPGAGSTRVMTVPNANFTAARTDAAQTFTGDQTFGVILSTRLGANITNPNSYAFNGDVNIAGGDSAGNATYSLVSSASGIGYLAFADGTSGTARYAGKVEYNHSTNTMSLSTNGGVEAISIGSSQNVTASAGNVIIGTAAKGIDFSANTGAAGETSALLNWYEEGTWTPTDGSGAGLTFTSPTGRYTRIGRAVHIICSVTYPSTASADSAIIAGLPFTTASPEGGMFLRYTDLASLAYVFPILTTSINVYTASGTTVPNSTLSTKRIDLVGTYFV